MLANPITMRRQSRSNGIFPERNLSALEGLVDNPIMAYETSHNSTMGPTAELDILSASRFPEGLAMNYDVPATRSKRKEAPTTNNKQFYGGIIFRASASPHSQDHDSSSAAEQEPQPVRPKKRAKKAKIDEDDANDDPSKKQRGRPRLDTQDETAADRRRTQIRLAQRAYRSRKESTIVGLKQRVFDLQDTIEKMNSTFLTLHDNLVDAGIANGQNALTSQLQAASDEFIMLARINDEDYEDEESQKIAEMNDNEKMDRPCSQKKASSAKMKNDVPSHKVTRQLNISDDGDVEELPNSQPYAYMDIDDWVGMQQDTMQFSVQVPEVNVPLDQSAQKQTLSAAASKTTTISRPLSSPGNAGYYTYSFQETSFARRLQRMTLERGFRNLTSPNVDAAYVGRAFRFTFCFSNRRRMLQRFSELLKRKAGESLENWNVPFFHIGGAGTHFPRRDAEGNAVYPPNMLPPEKAFNANYGPRAWVEVETPRRGTPQEILESIGFGGQWFDSHDVEEYLKTKGVFLDGTSSFIEIDPSIIRMTIPSLTQGTSSTENSSPTTGQSPPLRTPSPFIGNGGLQAAQDMYTPPELDFSMFDTSFEQGIGGKTAQEAFDKQIWPWEDSSMLPFDDPTEVTQSMTGYSHILSRRSQPLTFDVEKFLERMIDGSSCLGRAPGFRKELVDNALVMSLAEAF